MRKLRYEQALIQNVKNRKDGITEINLRGDRWSDSIFFKTYNAKDAYVLARIMELCGVRYAEQLIDKELQLVCRAKSVVAVSNDDNNEFYPMPSSELYYLDYSKLEYTEEELLESFS